VVDWLTSLISTNKLTMLPCHPFDHLTWDLPGFRKTGRSQTARDVEGDTKKL